MYDFWNDVYGVKMKTVASMLRNSKSRKPEVLKVDENDLLAKETVLCWIDLKDATLDDIEAFSMKHLTGEQFYSTDRRNIIKLFSDRNFQGRIISGNVYLVRLLFSTVDGLRRIYNSIHESVLSDDPLEANRNRLTG
jgi:hypothetical protein